MEQRISTAAQEGLIMKYKIKMAAMVALYVAVKVLEWGVLGATVYVIRHAAR